MKRKIRKLRGGGMDMGNKSNQAKSAAMGSSSSKSPGHPSNRTTSPSTNRATSNNSTTNRSTSRTTSANKNQFNTNNRDVPFKKPLNFAESMVVSSFLPFLGPGVNLAAKRQYKSRQKFATKEGLARDFYRMENKPLQPNSPTGKKYLKEAGFGKRPITPNLPKDDNPIIPYKIPIIPIEATKKVDPLLVKPKDNFFKFVAYKVGGLSGGVKYGPPPKRGPNSQVPPVKMKKGGYKK